MPCQQPSVCILGMAQKTGIPKWVARSVSGNMGTKTCGLPLRSFNFEPPFRSRCPFPGQGKPVPTRQASFSKDSS